jgi:uncharacterized membrane protein
MKPSAPPRPVTENIDAVVEIEKRAVSDRTAIDRATDAITGAAGSVAFVVVHVVGFAAWMWINTRFGYRFDPYPFTLLNLVVSLEAIVLTSLVLMTQNRMTLQADKRAHLDLQVNLLSEQELTAILRMVDALCRNSGVDAGVAAEGVSSMLGKTEVNKVAEALDDALRKDRD